jgi:hypothetical protein
MKRIRCLITEWHRRRRFAELCEDAAAREQYISDAAEKLIGVAVALGLLGHVDTAGVFMQLAERCQRGDLALAERAMGISE